MWTTSTAKKEVNDVVDGGVDSKQELIDADDASEGMVLKSMIYVINECMQQTHDQKTKLSYLGQIHFSHFSNIGNDPWEVANDENRDDDDRNPCQANVPFT